MQVFVFRHAEPDEIGTLGPALEARGFEVQIVDSFAPGARMPQVAEAAGLLFMGGTMCANDDLPFLHREMDLIREAVQLGCPVLGICLGSQLIAKALGARVHRNEAPEIGWFRIQVTAAGQSDPIFAQLENPQVVFHWHQDTWELPPGAQLLATAPACRNQAFRLGRSVYGLQFHPEMTPAMIEDWQRCGEAPETIDPALHAAPLARLCEKLVEGWTGTF
jgi:GMP synthase-like glutamine amidotransferase